MVQMQNLQSSLSDAILASGQSNISISDTGLGGSSTFKDILKSTSQKDTSQNVQKKNDASDGADTSSDAVQSKSSVVNETQGKGQTSEKKDDVDVKEDVVIQSMLSSQFIDMMNVSEADVSVAEQVETPIIDVISVPEQTVGLSAGYQADELPNLGQETVLSGEAQVDLSGAALVEDEAPKVQLTQDIKTDVSEKNDTAYEAADGKENILPQTESKQDSSFNDGRKSDDKAADSDPAQKDAAGKNKTDAENTSNVNVTVKESSYNSSSEFTAVKVGDGAQLEQKVVDQVADTVSVKLSEGTQEFEMTLNPEELGKVQIKLVFENGKAQVFMTCSDSEVQKALAANIQAVKQIIESNTGQEATVVVQTDSDKMGNYEDQRNGENNHHESNSEENNGNAGGSEAETLSFIQQLRLGLVEDQAV